MNAFDKTTVDQVLRAAILKVLRQHAIAEVRIEFNGAYDEGQIGEIAATAQDGKPGSLHWPCGVEGKEFAAGSRIWDHQASAYVHLAEPRAMTMYEVLDEWAWGLLGDTEVDWVNGDGGFGQIIITPEEGSVVCEMNVRHTAVEASRHEF